MDIVRKNSPRFLLKSIDYASPDFHEVLYCGLRDTIKVQQKTGYEIVRGKIALFRDDDHLSAEGAILLTPLFEPIFADLAK